VQHTELMPVAPILGRNRIGAQPPHATRGPKITTLDVNTPNRPPSIGLRCSNEHLRRLAGGLSDCSSDRPPTRLREINDGEFGLLITMDCQVLSIAVGTPILRDHSQSHRPTVLPSLAIHPVIPSCPPSRPIMSLDPTHRHGPTSTSRQGPSPPDAQPGANDSSHGHHHCPTPHHPTLPSLANVK
jgi:hypothetical protein